METDGAITVGRLHFEPNVTNIIPGKVTFTIDIRNTSSSQLDKAVKQIDQHLAQLEPAFKVRQTELVNVAPIHFDDEVINVISTAVEEAGLSQLKMPSGAGHDAQLMAGYCPSGMIFIPSRDGISHHKKEYSSPESIIHGANVLLNATAQLMAK